MKAFSPETLDTEYINDKVLDCLKEDEEGWNQVLCPKHCNRQCEMFPIGSIVYYVKDGGLDYPGRYYVSWGTVIEHFTGQVSLQLYEMYDDRMIDGIPVRRFYTPTEWRKLPKNWSYDTTLFEITHSKDFSSVDMKRHDPEYLSSLINDGILVKSQEKDYAQFETEISKSKGWRIVRKYEKMRSPYVTLKITDVYAAYEEAQAVIDDIHAEWKRQASLSDYDWSVEQIDNTLNIWSRIHHIDEETIRRYRNWILQLDRVEDVEVRAISSGVQWKYVNNKRWNNIELSV